MKEYAIMTHEQNMKDDLLVVDIEDKLNANAADGWEVLQVFTRPPVTMLFIFFLFVKSLKNLKARRHRVSLSE